MTRQSLVLDNLAPDSGYEAMIQVGQQRLGFGHTSVGITLSITKYPQGKQNDGHIILEFSSKSTTNTE